MLAEWNLKHTGHTHCRLSLVEISTLSSLVILFHTIYGECRYLRTCILPWVITITCTAECMHQRKVWRKLHGKRKWNRLKTKLSTSILKVEWKKWKVSSVWWSTSRYGSCENGRCNCIDGDIMHLEQIGGCKQDILSTTVCLQM